MGVGGPLSSDPAGGKKKKKKSLEREIFPRGREIMCSQC